MASKEIEQIQGALDEAFANFKLANPELAESMRVLNISYAEYLRVLFGLSCEPDTVSGNTLSLP
ncbi:MAG: hypothetical protein WCE23_13800 [Candidatus Binatus sp.]|uniref:hypothetical protein n=1 Tax=Candidatus Binatus sp. TaxID=2811406 RepID=UPI003C7341F4